MTIPNVPGDVTSWLNLIVLSAMPSAIYILKSNQTIGGSKKE